MYSVHNKGPVYTKCPVYHIDCPVVMSKHKASDNPKRKSHKYKAYAHCTVYTIKDHCTLNVQCTMLTVLLLCQSNRKPELPSWDRNWICIKGITFKYYVQSVLKIFG